MISIKVIEWHAHRDLPFHTNQARNLTLLNRFFDVLGSKG